MDKPRTGNHICVQAFHREKGRDKLISLLSL